MAKIIGSADTEHKEAFILGAFAKLRKAAITYIMSVRPRGTIRLPLDGFWWYLVFELFSNLCRENSDLVKMLHENVFAFMRVSRWVFLKMGDVSDRSCRKNQNTYCILCLVTFPENYAVPPTNGLHCDDFLGTHKWSTTLCGDRWCRISVKYNDKFGNLTRSLTGRRETADVNSHIPCRAPAVLCRGLEKSQSGMVGARQGYGMVCLNHTQSQCVIQVRKTQSKSSATRHGKGTAWCVWISLKTKTVKRKNSEGKADYICRPYDESSEFLQQCWWRFQPSWTRNPVDR
jgi:hypothetical protein